MTAEIRSGFEPTPYGQIQCRFTFSVPVSAAVSLSVCRRNRLFCTRSCNTTNNKKIYILSIIFLVLNEVM